MSQPPRDGLIQALADAAVVHHEYERTVLGGMRDEQWAGFYAAYALGRLGDFADASALSGWLEQSPSGGHWPTQAASQVLDRLTVTMPGA
jgi:hypothetical protein